MKKMKFFPLLLFVITFVFAACSNVDDPDDDLNGNTQQNDGTREKPFTVAEVINFYNNNTQGSYDDVWVKGYIVGGVKNELTGGGTSIQSAEDVVFGTTDIRSTAVLLADLQDEVDYLKCIVIKLNDTDFNPADFRSTVNLVDNPNNLRQELMVRGNLYRYFAVPAVREITEYEFQGGSAVDPDAIFSESFSTSLGQFSIYDVTGAQTWTHSTQYGATMSGYANNRSYENEDWLISPVISLSGETSITLSFNHAIGPAGSIGIDKAYFTVWFTNEYSSGDPNAVNWTQVIIPNFSTSAWNYVSSTLDVPAEFENETNVRFAFKYLSTDTESATWEIKNVVLK